MNCEDYSVKQELNMRRSIFCDLVILAPLRDARPFEICFPVVSANSDHRLLSRNPAGCRSAHAFAQSFGLRLTNPSDLCYRAVPGIKSH